MEDTVFALSTPLGGAMAMIRVSGPASLAIGEAVFTGSLSPRYAAFGRIVERGAGAVADEAVAVYFQAPSSYTGEDMLEFYVHGGSAAVKRVMALIAAAGCRPAGPGEFTKRAFLNGKMDLCRAEAVADIISAASSRAAALAAEQLSGALSRKIEEIEASLLSLLSGVSAAIDYPEELEEDVFSALPAGLAEAAGQLAGLIEGGASGRVLREGAQVVIVGRPNAGKSSLMNAMLGVDRAIVSDVSGTTRDIIEEQLDLCGVPVRLTDTAGLHESTDPVERMGMERARSAMANASLLLLAFDGSEPLSGADRRLLDETAAMPRLAVIGKGDLPLLPMPAELSGIPAYAVSAKTGEGIAALCQGIADMLAPEREAALVSNARHIEALKDALLAVESARTAMDADCVATDIRDALTALSKITGSEVDETVIDMIFSRFCVGK